MTGTQDTELVFVNEEFYADAVGPAQFDEMLALGWRHFGTHFFRYSLGLYRDEIRRVTPLRIRLADFGLSKSQSRVLRKNDDLHVEISPAEITDETEQLFHRHKQRFDHGVPDSIYNFLSSEPAHVPTDGFQITVRREAELLAVSFFDLGNASASAIYGCFDPDETRRSLGIFTMLKVIEFAASNAKKFYYHGYAYEGESFYDYKKRFAGLECFDWKGDWEPFTE